MRMADRNKPPEDIRHSGGYCQYSPYLEAHKSDTRKIKYHRQIINGEWKQFPTNITDQRYHSDGHSFKSVYQVQRLLILEPGETAAIGHLIDLLHVPFHLFGRKPMRLAKTLKRT